MGRRRRLTRRAGNRHSLHRARMTALAPVGIWPRATHGMHSGESMPSIEILRDALNQLSAPPIFSIISTLRYRQTSPDLQLKRPVPVVFVLGQDSPHDPRCLVCHCHCGKTSRFALKQRSCPRIYAFRMCFDLSQLRSHSCDQQSSDLSVTHLCYASKLFLATT
jgi:hypothetical protein